MHSNFWANAQNKTRNQAIVNIKTELVDQYKNHYRGAVFKTPAIIRQQDLLAAKGQQIPGMGVPHAPIRP